MVLPIDGSFNVTAGRQNVEEKNGTVTKSDREHQSLGSTKVMERKIINSPIIFRFYYFTCDFFLARQAELTLSIIFSPLFGAVLLFDFRERVECLMTLLTGEQVRMLKPELEL